MTELYSALGALLLLVAGLAAFPLYRVGQKQLAFMVAVLLMLGGVAGYGWFGSPGVVPKLADYRENIRALRETIQVSEALIQQNPNNIEAWLNMGQAFAQSGDYKAAARAYKQCVLLSKGNPLIIMAYAEALIADNGGVVDAQAKKSIDIALMIDKELPVARYYKAIWLLQNDQMPEAMQTMKQLYSELPDDSALKRKINEQIGR